MSYVIDRSIISKIISFESSNVTFSRKKQTEDPIMLHIYYPRCRGNFSFGKMSKFRII